MKKVTLYKVVSEDIYVHDFENYIRFRERASMIDFSKVGDNAVIANAETFIECPIYQWRQIEFGKNKGGFIAMAPKLREILETPFRRESDESIIRAWKETNHQILRAEKYINRISVYNSLPWYKRIFRKV
jgi:hypothetical protein